MQTNESNTFLSCSVGRWIGADFRPNGPILRTFCLHPLPDVHKLGGFWGRGTSFNILGNYTAGDDGTVQYAFTYAFTKTYKAAMTTVHWKGTLSDDGNTLSGKWGYGDDQPNTFIYKRVPQGSEVLKHHDMSRSNCLKFFDLLRKEMCRQPEDLSFEQLLSSGFHLPSKLDVDHLRCYYVLRDLTQPTAPIRS